jgi:hypothetical protein
LDAIQWGWKAVNKGFQIKQTRRQPAALQGNVTRSPLFA